MPDPVPIHILPIGSRFRFWWPGSPERPGIAAREAGPTSLPYVRVPGPGSPLGPEDTTPHMGCPTDLVWILPVVVPPMESSRPTRIHDARLLVLPDAAPVVPGSGDPDYVDAFDF